MMSQQFQQPEPPKRSNTMKDVGWPIILVIATVLGSIIGAIILGTTHVIGFNWLLLIWGCIMLGIAVFFAWYSIRTRIILQKQYQEDVAKLEANYLALRSILQKKYQEDVAKLEADYLAFKTAYTDHYHNEMTRWDKWAIDFSQTSTKEQKERLEEVKKQLSEHIGDVNRNLSTRIQNNWNRTTEWENTHNVAHGEEQKIYMHQLETLKDTLTDKQLSERDN